MRFCIRDWLQICKFLFDLDNLSSFLSTFSNLGEPETNPYKKQFYEGGRGGRKVGGHKLDILRSRLAELAA